MLQTSRVLSISKDDWGHSRFQVPAAHLTGTAIPSTTATRVPQQVLVLLRVVDVDKKNISFVSL